MDVDANNPLRISVSILAGTLPLAPVIAADDLTRHYDVTDSLAIARQEIEQLAAAANTELQQARTDAEVLRTQALNLAEAEVAKIKSDARETAIVQATEWLFREAEMEQVIARQLESRWRSVIAQVLGELMVEEDQREYLIRFVKRRVDDLFPRGRVTLWVPPSALSVAAHAFGDSQEVSVLSDEELKEGHARLDNGLVRIHLDWPAHQMSVLDQLSRAADGDPHA